MVKMVIPEMMSRNIQASPESCQPTYLTLPHTAIYVSKMK